MFRGQRFELDLEDEEEEEEEEEEDRGQQSAPLSGAFVGDILERKPIAATPPSAPTLKSKGGFPEHRKRNVGSRFKQQKAVNRNHGNSPSLATVASNKDEVPSSDARDGDKAKTWEEEEKERIDLENQQKLAQMSPEEIEEERRELMSSLSPALLQRFLQRSTIDSGSTEVDLSTRSPEKVTEVKKPKLLSTKTVSFIEPSDDDDDEAEQPADIDHDNDDREVPLAETLPHDSVHFPKPSQPPDLDPSSETFLEDLHEKYFPSLPSEPDKLEWMQPSSSSKNNYDPSASAFNPKDLRFSFKGELIPPKTASDIPVTAGLHHHGDAPDAAGYTIPELAHLAQSSYAAQRCIAFQTLGRILYRLGKGEFGDSGEPGGEADDTFGELARGLWQEVEKGKVIEILVRESEGKGADRGRHVSAKAYATEAVWSWRKGGGRRWKAA